MEAVNRVLASTPNRPMIERSSLAECIDACATCGLSCIACADACDGETRYLSTLRRCVRLNLDCADICEVTARVLSRQLAADADVLRAQIEACSVACAACAEECESHADTHEHCRACAAACRACEEHCRRVTHEIAASA